MKQYMIVLAAASAVSTLALAQNAKPVQTGTGQNLSGGTQGASATTAPSVSKGSNGALIGAGAAETIVPGIRTQQDADDLAMPAASNLPAGGGAGPSTPNVSTPNMSTPNVGTGNVATPNVGTPNTGTGNVVTPNPSAGTPANAAAPGTPVTSVPGDTLLNNPGIGSNGQSTVGTGGTVPGSQAQPAGGTLNGGDTLLNGGTGNTATGTGTGNTATGTGNTATGTGNSATSDRDADDTLLNTPVGGDKLRQQPVGPPQALQPMNGTGVGRTNGLQPQPRTGTGGTGGAGGAAGARGTTGGGASMGGK